MDEQQQRRTTDEQRVHFWAAVQDNIAAIVAQAELYLPDMDDEDAALDSKAVEEILNVLYQARAAADTAAGAYARVTRHVRHNRENAPAGHRQPAAYQQPPAHYAVSNVPGAPQGWR
jgi:hypothetical protein